MGLIELRNLAINNRLAPLSLHINTGELVGIIGANGAGKSTLLSALAGVQKYQGEALLNGVELQQFKPLTRAQKIAYLAQNHNSAWQLNVQDVVALGRLPWADESAEAIEHALQQCDLLALRAKPIHQLSGGQQARVWLARVLAGQPQVLLADEPLAALDLVHQRNILQLLREQARDTRAVLLSLHDLSLAARYCDKLCLLTQGRLVAYGTPAQVLTEEHLEQAFGLKIKVDLSVQPAHIAPL